MLFNMADQRYKIWTGCFIHACTTRKFNYLPCIRQTLFDVLYKNRHPRDINDSFTPMLHVTLCIRVCLSVTTTEQFCMPVVEVGAVVKPTAAELARLCHIC